MKKYIIAIAAIVCIIIAQNLLTESSEQIKIIRPEYDSESELIDFNAEIDREKITTSIEIEPVSLSSKEAYELFQKIRATIQIPEQVYDGKLELSTEIGGIDIFWLSSNEQLISNEGDINPYVMAFDESEEVTLTAVLSYQDYRCEYEFNVRVTCLRPDTVERKRQWLNYRINTFLGNNLGEKELELPGEIDGIEVSYNTNSNDFGLFIVVGVIAVIAFVVAKRADVIQQQKKNNRELEIDYCEVVSKLVLLMGAGLTIRGAWERIVADYQKSKRATRLVYEEMAVTMNELASGVPERIVYESFGKRCKLPRYIKLGSLLQQNFIKGSKQLLSLLENESDVAFEDRKLLAKKQGEEAGTKLLLPMLLELVAVMAIVMVPALMNF